VDDQQNLDVELIKRIVNRIIFLEVQNSKENLFSKEQMINRIKRILEEEVDAALIN